VSLLSEVFNKLTADFGREHHNSKKLISKKEEDNKMSILMKVSVQNILWR